MTNVAPAPSLLIKALQRSSPSSERRDRVRRVKRELRSPAHMVRLTDGEADVLFKGKTPREIYEIAWDQVANAPRARINDLHDTVIWLVEQRYLTEVDLNAIEDEPGEEINTNPRP